MTRLGPTAFLALDGVDVARSTVAGVPTDLLAMDGLAVTWGRTEALDQQEPATASVALFDPSRRWHLSRSWVGVPVTLRWEITIGGVTTVRTFFRGRVAKVNPVVTTLAGIRGSLVTLDLTSVVADLANVLPTIAWPEENLGSGPSPKPGRRVRLEAALAAAGVTGGMGARTDWDAFAAATVNADEQVSLSEHVRLFYDSLVERYTYSPTGDRMVQVSSRDYSTRRTLGRLASDPVGAATDRAGQGVYARARSLNTGPGLYLNAREIDYPPDAGIARDQTSAITRVRLATTDLVNSVEVKTWAERVVAGANEATNGVRTLNVDSGISSSAQNLQLTKWETMVRQDAAAWQLEPLGLRLAPAGGLEELDQLLHLMVGNESNALFFLQGSELPLYGVLPVVGVMGGVITHDGGSWELELNVAPISLTAAQHPLSCEELDTGLPATQIQAWDTPNPLGFHPSLTFEDLAWVGLGHGAADTDTFTDRGWDYLT